jgi:hypothetical protein
MKAIVLLATLTATLFSLRHVEAAGVSVAVTPASGACTDALTVHAAGLTPNAEVHLFVGTNDGARGELVTFDWPTATTWDFTMQSGVRYLCDEFAAPDMRVSLWSSVGPTGAPAGLLGIATFTRTAADAVPSGPTIAVRPDHGTCSTPLLITGNGFPPNQPIEFVLGPIYTTPGSGGAGIAVPGGTTGADGSFSSNALSSDQSDGRPATDAGHSTGATECQRFARLKITAAPRRANDGSRNAFTPAETVFRRADVLAPTVGGGVIRHSSPSTWLVLGGASLLVAAALAAASAAHHKC